MRVHNGGSGPRSNKYSSNRFTNWSEYEPWWLEVQSVFKRFNGKIAKNPKFPKVIEFGALEGFVRPCTARQVEVKLRSCPPELLKGLRAVFILSGTKKQLKSWSRSNCVYGHYWNCCVFLHAYPSSFNVDLDGLNRFYINDTLMHEVAHHLDLQNTTKKDRERFAERFVRSLE